MTQFTQFPPQRLDPIEIAGAIAIVIATFTGMGILLTLVRAWGRRISQPKGQAGDVTEVREELLADVQQLRQELVELSERVDFTERVLAKQREASKLPPAS